MPVIPIEPIIIVHGTYSSKSTWWQKDSIFCKLLDSHLAAYGSPARCWSSPIPLSFSWSGRNSETDRRLASHSLFRLFIDLENATDVSHYHVIAHSHGGNIAVDACRNLFALHSNLIKAPVDDESSYNTKLTTLITLGTPFIQYHSNTVGRLFLRLMGFPVVVFILLFFWLFYLGVQDTNFWLVALPLSIYMMLGFGVATHIIATSIARPVSLPVNFRRYSILSSYDEAVWLLKTASSMKRGDNKALPLSLYVPRFPILGRSMIYRMGLNLFYDTEWTEPIHEYAKQKKIYILDKMPHVGSSAIFFLLPSMALNLVWDRVLRIYARYARAPTLLWILEKAQRISAAATLGDDFLDEEIAGVDRRPTDIPGEDIAVPVEVEQALLANSTNDVREVIERIYLNAAEDQIGLGNVLDIVMSDRRLVHNQYPVNDWVLRTTASLIADPREEV